MKEVCFAATYQDPDREVYGILLKTREEEPLYIVTTREWVEFYEFWVLEGKGKINTPLPLAWNLATFLGEAGLEIDHAELHHLTQNGEDVTVASLFVKTQDGRLVRVTGRAAEVIMTCLHKERPVMAEESLIWLATPKGFFESLSPSDFFKAYQDRFMSEQP